MLLPPQLLSSLVLSPMQGLAGLQLGYDFCFGPCFPEPHHARGLELSLCRGLIVISVFFFSGLWSHGSSHFRDCLDLLTSVQKSRMPSGSALCVVLVAAADCVGDGLDNVVILLIGA